MEQALTRSKILTPIVIVAALGYFVDIYDLLLFGVERVDSLKDILKERLAILSGKEQENLIKYYGDILLNWQMGGMLAGGIFWGILGDKRGRLSVLFGSIITYSVANILNGMVTDTDMYALLRFISGFGLAGELGAGITLVSETMSKENRGIGTMIVATVGVFGAVVAGYMGKIITDWRVSFYIGGGMGLLLLLLRIGVVESGMYHAVKTGPAARGDFFLLFKKKERLKKYFSIIFVAVPVWYVMGSLVLFAPELSKWMKIPGGESIKSAGDAIMYAYAGITLGDLASGLISHLIRSRKKALALFLFLTAAGIIMFFTVGRTSVTMFYWVIAFIGFATGYWAVFMSTAAELFGTNIRSTATTTAPNFVRASTIPISALFGFITMIAAGDKPTDAEKLLCLQITGGIVLTVAFIALYKLEETFGKELNYTE